MIPSHLRKDALALVLVLPALMLPAAPAFAQEAPKPTAEMQAVLDKLKELQAQPVSTLTVPQARMQASAADAAAAVQRDRKISPAPESKVTTKDIAIPAKSGNLPARLYIPEGGAGPLPVIVYYHGGGWVIADINTYDASARGLALGAGAIVVSVDYRHAPEHKFPAQHQDAYDAYVWTVENIGSENGDTRRIAVAGESAGANLAADVALMAKEMKATLPVHQLLVYPIASNSMETPSKKAFTDTAPLSTPDIGWFVDHVFAAKAETADPRVNLVGRTDLSGLPPATVIAAEIDPLRSETEEYAEKLKTAGVSVNAKTFSGVTHEFFGMAKILPQAKEAMEMATGDLKQAFAKTAP
ncbi:lipase [Aureimonas sp. Leaf454]|uniref:alpha/beta hydrolase n=1 Tax=Aureimonas sp. Leaf454 TaxID=1736381 RepID=UPI0006F35EAE|nr:alpha/beta hydrolase [Aureimonas sp. Leaf454]KQT53130.1 lipase [Aureimonas sp. Leaf454]